VPMRLSAEPRQAATNGTPSPGLPSVAFNRGLVGSGELEARVAFVLLVRPE
jgi:hypothetical protein